MASLLFVAFLLQLAVHVVNTVGASTINELVSLYSLACFAFLLTMTRSFGCSTASCLLPLLAMLQKPHVYDGR